MAVFIGDNKNTSAAICALNINYATIQIINPTIKECYSNSTYQVKHVVGIDTGNMFIARTGIRGSNDLVWVGRAANYAAKLSELSSDYPSRITKDVYDVIHDSAKYSTNGEPMWAPCSSPRTPEPEQEPELPTTRRK